MGRLFGTDGVRGLANKDLTADLALRLSAAAAAVLGAHDLEGVPLPHPQREDHLGVRAHDAPAGVGRGGGQSQGQVQIRARVHAAEPIGAPSRPGGQRPTLCLMAFHATGIWRE